MHIITNKHYNMKNYIHAKIANDLKHIYCIVVSLSQQRIPEKETFQTGCYFNILFNNTYIFRERRYLVLSTRLNSLRIVNILVNSSRSETGHVYHSFITIINTKSVMYLVEKQHKSSIAP